MQHRSTTIAATKIARSVHSHSDAISADTSVVPTLLPVLRILLMANNHESFNKSTDHLSQPSIFLLRGASYLLPRTCTRVLSVASLHERVMLADARVWPSTVSLPTLITCFQLTATVQHHHVLASAILVLEPWFAAGGAWWLLWSSSCDYCYLYFYDLSGCFCHNSQNLAVSLSEPASG